MTILKQGPGLNVQVHSRNEYSEIIKGPDVLAALANEALASDWALLYQACTWATVFQSYGYVSTWYRLYANKYEPILVISHSGGHVTGVLALATNGKTISGAGLKDAYYQTWLSEEYNKETFIKEAIRLVMAQYPGRQLLLQQLPPDTPLQWAISDSYWKRKCEVRIDSRPLIDLKAPDLPNLFTKKNIKENRNRLKRFGEIQFYQVTSLLEFAAIFDELATHFDFRKEVTLRRSPFRSDPLKKTFLLSLFEAGMLYVGVLKVDTDVVAALVATVGANKWIHGVGFNIHLPTYGSTSPGTLSFVMMTQDVLEKGYSVFDLTTGGNPYKDRLANKYDTVYELRVGGPTKPSRKKSLAYAVKQTIKGYLRQKGVSVKELKFRLKMQRAWLLEKAAILGRNGLVVGLQHVLQARHPQVYKVRNDDVRFSVEQTGVDVRLNNVADLQGYVPTRTLQTRWEFLSKAMRMLEQGHMAYTCALNGKLQACIWKHKPGAPYTELKHQVALPVNALVFDWLYVHPDEKRLVPAMLATVLQSVLQGGGSANIFVIAHAWQVAQCRFLEKA